MAGGEIKANGIVVFFDDLGNHFLGSLAKGVRIVVDLRQATHDEAFQLGEFPGAF